jgi:phosphosulfolactate synthase
MDMPILPFLPERSSHPRNKGLTMVMDKGLSLRQAQDMVESSDGLVDMVKLGFGTSFVSPQVEKKIKIYRESGIRVYMGGTLFEAFLVRNMLDEYIEWMKRLNIDTIEVSDGSIRVKHEVKCDLINRLSKDFTVLSEVGSKEAGIIIDASKWKSMMSAELAAGSWKVIAEARESGTVGIYRPNGVAHVALINKILAKLNPEQILWEAPKKEQQVWFIKLLGANVNLGNIAPEEVIPLETLRLGLRGDTFFSFLPDSLKKHKQVISEVTEEENTVSKENVFEMDLAIKQG